MNHFLHLLVLLPALFTTIVAIPTPIVDTSNSWTDSPLDNADTLLAATLGGVTDTLNSPPPGVTPPALTPTVPIQPPPLQLPPLQLPPPQPTPPTVDNSDWSKPMFLCCNSISWWNDEEGQCLQRSRRWNDQNCMAGQGTAKYCPRGIRSGVTLDCYRYRAGPDQ